MLNSSGIPVDKAFLYGSYSRNEATDDSDIDIMIVSKIFDDSNTSDLVKAKVWRLTEETKVKIEPYIVGLQRFIYDDVSPLMQIVRKEGIEIKLS